MLETGDCCLCSQIGGDPANDLIARLLPDQPYARRVLLESTSFAVIPDLGPLSRGHVLLCPKHHIRSFAQLDSSLHDEYEQQKARVERLLTNTYTGDIHVFEHGMAANGHRTLCTVDHAHMHFIPLPRTFGGPDIDWDLWSEFDGSIRALTELSRGSEYILYEAADRAPRLRVAFGDRVESQYMRQVFARGLSRGRHWNWRDAPDAHAADDTWRSCLAADATGGTGGR